MHINATTISPQTLVGIVIQLKGLHPKLNLGVELPVRLYATPLLGKFGSFKSSPPVASEISGLLSSEGSLILSY